LPAKHPAFVAINRLAALNLLPLKSRDVDFRPDDEVEGDWMAQVAARCSIDAPAADDTMTRGEFCRLCWKQVRQRGLEQFAFRRQSPGDADGDGIADRDDALPFTSNEPIVFRIEHDSVPPKHDAVPPERDGVPTQSNGRPLLAIDFCGPEVKSNAGFQADRGLAFDDERGFGWGRDLSHNHRRRNALDGARDSFIFTRERDRWECAVADGTYRVVLCAGDSGHEQLKQFVAVEGTTVIDQQTTAAGEFAEVKVEVKVTDERLTIDVGSGQDMSNTCLNWIQIWPVQ
jgi:hypothetical protein